MVACSIPLTCGAPGFRMHSLGRGERIGDPTALPQYSAINNPFLSKPQTRR